MPFSPTFEKRPDTLIRNWSVGDYEDASALPSRPPWSLPRQLPTLLTQVGSHAAIGLGGGYLRIRYQSSLRIGSALGPLNIPVFPVPPYGHMGG